MIATRVRIFFRILVFIAACLLLFHHPTFADPAQENTWILTPTYENEAALSEQTKDTDERITLRIKGEDFPLECNRFDVPLDLASDIPAEGMEEMRDAFIPLESKDTKLFFDRLGAFFTWSTDNKILFIFSSKRDIFFGEDYCKSRFKGKEKEFKRGFRQVNEITYLPLCELIALIGVDAKKTGDGIYDLISCIDDLYIEEDKGHRQIVFHSPTPMEFRVEKSEAREYVLFFPGAISRLTEEKMVMDGVEASVTLQKDTEPGVRIDVNLPKNWGGRLLPRMITGETVLQLVPDFPLKAGYRYESIKQVDEEKGKDECSVRLSATGPIQYFWQYDESKSMLCVDIPLATLDSGVVASPEEDLGLANLKIRSFVTSYGATRLVFTFKQNAAFRFETNKDEPHSLRIRLSAGKDLGQKQYEGRDFTGPAEAWGTVVIDPGHGGCDPGACNYGFGLSEKHINLDIARRLASLLQQSGWVAILTRQTDVDVSWPYSPNAVELQARADVANVNGASVFISLHCNASTNPSMSGFSVHWCKEEDYPLATSIQEVMGSHLPLVNRGVVHNNFYVLRNTNTSSILVEMAHISNYYDASRLAQPGFRQRIAEVLSTALNRYLSGRFARRQITNTGESQELYPARGSFLRK